MKNKRVPNSFIEELLSKCPADHFLAVRINGEQYEVINLYHGAIRLRKMDGFKKGLDKVFEATDLEIVNYWYVQK